MTYSSLALAALTPDQILFLESLPKAELHAHLNGSIPLPCLEQLAKNYTPNGSVGSSELAALIKDLANGVQLEQVNDFFGLFPAIYALTSNVHSLGIATQAVLREFLKPKPSVSGVEGAPAVAQCSYLELRSTPRETSDMTRLEYVQTVLGEVEKYPSDRAAMIVSVDRRMSQTVADEVVDIAIQMKKQGRRVVGVDLCGSPTANDVSVFGPPLIRAREAGLGLTLHIAETPENTIQDTMDLLELLPAGCKARLGHATFLNPATQLIVLDRQHAIEICLSSNLLCKSVLSLEAHHVVGYLKAGHPLAISTDDILPFRTNLLCEYALLMALPPLGLGLNADEVRRIAETGIGARF